MTLSATLLATFAAASAALAAEPAAPPVPERAFALAWTEQSYLGRHQALRAAAHKLEAGVASLCARPERGALESAQNDWRETHLAWRQVDGAGAAPTVIARTGRMIDFRPARVRDVEARIARGAGPDRNNVAVRGLGTLEYLLFGDAQPDQLDALRNPARCAYATATAGLLAAEVRALDQGWEQQLERLGGGIDLPRRNLLAENIGLMISGLDGALGRFPKVREARREAWPDWRSGSTRAAIGAQLDGFALAWSGRADAGQSTSASLATWMKGLGHGEAAGRVDAALEQARSAWRALPEQLDTTPAEPARQAFTDSLLKLRETVEREVAGRLGVVLGFNDNDGD